MSSNTNSAHDTLLCMRKNTHPAWLVLMQLSGIVGAGAFALPAAFRTTGVFFGSLAFWAMALIVMCLHLLYAEIILARPDLMRARLPGQAGVLFGPWAKRFAYIVYPAKLVGACVAYILLGGQFLSVLFSYAGITAPLIVWQTIFWIGGLITIAFGLAFVAKVESWLARGLIFLVLLCVVLLLPQADGAVFQFTALPAFSTIPFGTFIFALIGWTIIPEIAVLLNHAPRPTKLAVAGGSLAGAFLMWLFGIIVYASNVSTIDLGPVSIASTMPPGWAWLIPALGFLAIASCFVAISEAFSAMLQYDTGFSVRTSRSIAVGLPFAILFFIAGDFQQVVDFVGSYFSTLNALIICAMAWVVLKKVEHRRELWRLAAPWICGAVFFAILLEKLLMR